MSAKKIKHVFDEQGIEKKNCSRCRQPKDLDLFYKNSTNSDGLESRCKQCYVETQQERTAMYAKVENWSLYLWKRSKDRSTKKKIEHNIVPEDLVVPDICPVLGIPLFRNSGKRASDNSPSLDRIDPKKGYVKDNVHVISNRANTLKSNSSIEELEKVIQYMESFS